MDFYSTFTRKAWASTCPQPGGVAPDSATNGASARLDSTLIECLQAETLVVLAGLGTSLCVQGSDGKRIAPSMEDLWKTAKTLGGADFASICEQVRYDTATGGNIENLLSQCHLSEKFQPAPKITDFIKRVEAALVKSCRFVNANTAVSVHQAFLRKIARRPPRLARARVFTTNYDLCFEVAANRSRFVAIDGFSHTSPQEFDGLNFSYDFVRRDPTRDAPEYVPNVFHLYKLHGSVDWERVEANQVVRSIEPRAPLLIYPRSTKYESSYDQPFLEVMSRLQASIREPNSALFVIGFGFNDHHIAQPVLSAIQSNIGLRLVVVDPAIKDSKRTAHKQMRDLIDGGDSRLTLVAGTFEDFVQQLPDLVAPTEDEQHRRRVGPRP